jgi:branched-subunit amino acid transport protein
MSVGWQFVLAGIGTYLIRVSAIAMVGQGMAIPPGVERTLRLIAPAVLAAIIANGLILDHGQINQRVSWYAGTLVAGFVVWRFRSAAWAMAVAMVVAWALQQAGVR